MFAPRYDPFTVVDAQQSDEDESMNSSPEEGAVEVKKDLAEPESDNTSDPESSDNSDESEQQVPSEEQDESVQKKRKRDDESSNESSSENEPSQDEEYENPIETNDSLVTEPYVGSHSLVLKRFQKTMKIQSKLEERGLTNHSGSEEEETIEKKDLAPLPQPKLPKDKNLYSNEIKNKNLNWLAQPEYHQTTVTMPFTSFTPPINPTIINNLKEKFGIESAFSVQISVIQSLLTDISKNKLNPKPFGDYLVNASTGSGKTLAYLIPIVQSLIGRSVPKLRCIILVPTRPLINQVYNNLLNLTRGINLNMMVFKNDLSLNDEHFKFNQVQPDLLITTPGRLVDHITNFDLDLKALKFLVVDEADRLLNQSFQNWCDLLISKLESQQISPNKNFYNSYGVKCSKLIFSATLTTDSEKLSHLKLFKPKLVVINDANSLVNELYQLPPNLDEFLIKIPEPLSFYKPLILMNFLKQQEYSSHGLIFTKSNESSIRLTRLLDILIKKFNINLTVHSINSSLKNQERSKMLKSFDENGGLLISTDLISRGLNLDSIKFVVNYDLPLSTKEYIHRVGRTARANKYGKALTFTYGDGEFKWFKKLVYSGGVIHRNGKSINEIKFVKECSETVKGGEIEWALELTDSDKELYDIGLKELQSEVQK